MTTQEKIQYLLDNGFSYTQLAKICKCHSSSISKWLSGQIKISNRLEESIKLNIQSFLEDLNKIWSD